MDYLHYPGLGRVRAIRLKGVGLQPAAKGHCIRAGDIIICHWGAKYRVRKIGKTAGSVDLHLAPYGKKAAAVIHTVPFAKLIGITPGTLRKMYRRYRMKKTRSGV